MECVRFRSTFEPKDMDFIQLTRQKYGDDVSWHEMNIVDQVELIKETLLSKNRSINPNSDYMKCWDFVVVFCLSFTAIVTPVEVAFLKPVYDYLYGINRFVDLVFVKDMGLQFFLQIRKTTKQGVTWLKTPKEITKVYLKTWFLIDLLAILPYDDLTSLIMGANSDNVGKLRIVRLARVMRLVKLLRILKASRVIMRWQTRISLKYVTIYLIRFTVLIILSCHWMACIWGFFGVLEGKNLECRKNMSPDDSRLSDYPLRDYFVKDHAADPFNPDNWDGESWVVNFARNRAASTNLDPCSPTALYVVSLYWAVMTMTSIGYGDVQPSVVAEYVVCSLCMMISSILWAYIISNACGIMMSMDPEQAEYERRVDSFNAMAKDIKVPYHLRIRGREYLREERCHERYIRNLKSMNFLGLDLRCSVARVMASHYLNEVWFLKKATPQLKASVASEMVPHFHERREIVEHHGLLCVVERGAVGRGGRVLVPWSYWGEDMLLRTESLRRRRHCVTLTFTEIVTLSRASLSQVLWDYPEDLKWFRRCAACIALVRMASLYSLEKTGKRPRQPQFAWLHSFFQGAELQSEKSNATSNVYEVPLGEKAPLLEARLEQLSLQLEQLTSAAGSPTGTSRVYRQASSFSDSMHSAWSGVDTMYRTDSMRSTLQRSGTGTGFMLCDVPEPPPTDIVPDERCGPLDWLPPTDLNQSLMAVVKPNAQHPSAGLRATL